MDSSAETAGDRATLARGVAELAERGTDAVSDVVDLVIGTAVRLGASDVHLEPASADVGVRLRLDGVMQDFGSLPLELGPNIVARCKVMAGLLTYRCDVPQEGGGSGRAHGVGVELRISTFPTLHGERVAIRIFDPAQQRRELDALGLSDTVRAALARSLSSPEGLVLLSGPSGSGKTTTLYACLTHILAASRGGRTIVTVEDPIENEIAGVTQTGINLAAGLTFASSLRSLLRQNPEVIMVGEVRDNETAHIVVEAALTGHLVLSTVHAPRAAVVPHRLLDMGVEPYALAGALGMVLAQRLARRVCTECSRPAQESETAGVPDRARSGAKVAVGCDACHGTGYRGRVLVAEKLSASEALHDAIMSKAPRNRFLEIAAAEQEDLEAAAWELVAQGVTTPYEVRRVLAGGAA